IPRPRAINWITPLLHETNGQAEVIFQGDAELTAYDAATGKERWSFKNGMHSIISPALAGDRILATGGGEAFCLAPCAGKAEPKTLWKTNKLRSGYSTPLYADARVYNVTSANVLVCLDAVDAKVLWQERVRGPISASLVAAEGKLYALS